MPHSIKHLRRHLCLPLLALALLATGCGGSPSADEVAYDVGEALSDSTTALTVSSEYGSDTVATPRYRKLSQMRIRKLSPSERTPDTLQAIHRDFVKQFVAAHALRGEASARDIAVDEAKVSSQLNMQIQKYGGRKKLERMLARRNMTIDSLRSSIADQLQTRALQRQMAESTTEPTASEVEKYSKENQRIRAQHILLEAENDASQSKVDSTRRAAAALIDSAKAGTDFAALARRHSDDDRSAKKGGDLGFFSKDSRMADAFSEAAFALADSGDVTSEPVRTQFGFHVIRLTNAGEPMDTSEARKKMMQERKRETLDQELEKLLEKATVRANPSVVEAGFYSIE